MRRWAAPVIGMMLGLVAGWSFFSREPPPRPSESASAAKPPDPGTTAATTAVVAPPETADAELEPPPPPSESDPAAAPPGRGAAEATAKPAAPRETADAELERLVTTKCEEWGDEKRTPAPPREQAARRSVILAARARAEADVAAGTPRIVSYGLTMGDAPDIDAETGFAYRYLGCVVHGDDQLETLAYNAAVLRALREGRVTTGSFLDRSATETQVTEWLTGRGHRLERGGPAVALPGGAGEVRIPKEPCGSWSGGGDHGDLFDIERPSIKQSRAKGWPSLHSASALLGLRKDGRAYAVAEPADAARWTRRHVFDAATGYHVHTLHRTAPK